MSAGRTYSYSATRLRAITVAVTRVPRCCVHVVLTRFSRDEDIVRDLVYLEEDVMVAKEVPLAHVQGKVWSMGRFKRFQTFAPNFQISVPNIRKPSTFILNDDPGNFRKGRPVGATQRSLHHCVHYTPHTAEKHQTSTPTWRPQQPSVGGTLKPRRNTSKPALSVPL